jgi:RNA exonuclease 4
MRERRKKKKLADMGGGHHLKEWSDLSHRGGKKRPRPDDDDDDDDDEKERKSFSNNDLDGAVISLETSQKEEKNGVKHTTAPSASSHRVITVPAGLSSKEAKKFRKEARRKARRDEISNDLITFRVEGEETTADEEPAQKKKQSNKRHHHFPRINELVEQDRQRQKQKERTEAEDSLSEEYKNRYVAVDCEMVGTGSEGRRSVLARVSCTDWYGNTLLDTYVKVPIHVTDFRTHVSGVQPKHLKNESAMDETECREKVASLLKNKIWVGHAVKNDLDALLLQHPVHMIRDTAKYRPFQRLAGNKWRPRKLRDLVNEHLQLSIQRAGESHDSVQDARATMELFKTVRTEWEKELELRQSKKKSYKN